MTKINKYERDFNLLFERTDIDIKKLEKQYQKFKTSEFDIEVFQVFLALLLTPLFVYFFTYFDLMLILFAILPSIILSFILSYLICLKKNENHLLLSHFKFYKNYINNRKKYFQKREALQDIFEKKENLYLIYAFFEASELNINESEYRLLLKKLQDNIEQNDTNHIIDITFELLAQISKNFRIELNKFKENYEEIN